VDTADPDTYVQAVITTVVLVDPITRSIFFKALTEREPEKRPRYVRTIMVTVALVLGIAALAGRELLDLIGINLGAFGIAGGLVLTTMGFEMLLGGEPSRAQGGKEAREEERPQSAESQILVPYSIPFMCGPGAITGVITIASSTGDGSGTVAALVGVAVAVALIPVGHILLINRLNVSERTMGIVTRFGGLFIATIGVQLILGGIDTFFELS
jgi:multiple antibiotic resistance protein